MRLEQPKGIAGAQREWLDSEVPTSRQRHADGPRSLTAWPERNRLAGPDLVEQARPTDYLVTATGGEPMPNPSATRVP